MNHYDKWKAGLIEFPKNHTHTCTATERAFLDEIREKFEVSKDFKGDPDYAIHIPKGHSMCQQYDFETNLKELVNE